MQTPFSTLAGFGDSAWSASGYRRVSRVKPTTPITACRSGDRAIERTLSIQAVLADAWDENDDIQSVHRQHQGQNDQGSGILPSAGESEGACKTRRATCMAQDGLRVGTWPCQRDHFVHPEPRTRKREAPGRCTEERAKK